jgi:cation-transporting ATPase 13A2
MPFMLTMLITLAFSVYLLFTPAHALYHLMQLTKMSTSFKFFLSALALVGFAGSYLGEKWLFPFFAMVVGHWKNGGVDANGKRRKKQGRKLYKIVLETDDGVAER